MNKIDKDIAKKLLLFCTEIKILKILRYNKRIQKSVDIDFNFYRNYAKRYIIYKDKNKNFGNEYNKDNLEIYEGEFVNEKRSGKGKEFNSLHEIIFDGDYLYGKRNGRITEYNNRELIFLGEHFNNKRQGRGIEYDKGQMIFEGEYFNGMRHGFGKELHFIKLFDYLFNGEYKNGIRWEGKGEEYDQFSNLTFEGEYK